MSTHRPRSVPDKPEPPNPAIGSMTGRAVDTYDLASHLESQGYGDRYAKSGGFSSVFDLAHDLFSRAERAPVPRRRMAALVQARDRLFAALSRSIALVAGVVICLCAVQPGRLERGMAVAGAGAWLTAHLISVVLWAGLSRSRKDAASAGLPVVLVGLVAATLAGALFGTVAGAWTAWGCASAVLTVLVAFRRPLGFAFVMSAGAALTVCLSTVAPQYRVPVSLALMGVALVAALLVLLAEKVRLRPLPVTYHSTMWLGVVQAGGQIAAFFALLAALPAGMSTWVAIGGLAASAIADPALEIVQILVRESVTRSTSWSHGHRMLRWWTMTTVFVVVIIAGIIGGLVAQGASLGVRVECGLGTAALAAVTVGVGALLRAGDARGAALAASGAAGIMTVVALVVVAFPVSRPPLLLVAVVLLLVGSLTTTRRVLTHPALW